MGSCIKSHVQRHLVVAAASGMQLLSGVTDSLYQGSLHKAVDVLLCFVYGKLSCLYVLPDACQSLYNGILLFYGENALFSKHNGMCNASFHVLGKEIFVKGNGCIKIKYFLFGGFGKTSAP